MQSKSKLLKLHDAIFDLQKVVYIETRLNKMWFFFDLGQTTYYECETREQALEIFEKCYEIMKDE